MTRILGWAACVGAVALLVVAMIAGNATAAPGARITGATVRLSPVPGRPAAGYFTLTAGAAAVELTAVASPPARIELHGMSMAGDVMRMDRLPSVRVAAGHAARFAPGASHLMLFGVPSHVRPGATLPLAFTFADGTTIKVGAAVVAAGSDPATAMPAMNGPVMNRPELHGREMHRPGMHGAH